MGFDVHNVKSDDKHYGPFICTICHDLVSLDCLVTSTCSHPFCRVCLEDYVMSRLASNKTGCSCPTCQQDLTPATPLQITGTMLFGASGSGKGGKADNNLSTRLCVQPLSTAQPLAMKVLQLVQVTCFNASVEPGSGGGKNKYANLCGWTGDYGKFQQHNNVHEKKENPKDFKLGKALSALPGADRVGMGLPNARHPYHPSHPHQLQRSSSLPSVLSEDQDDEKVKNQKNAKYRSKDDNTNLRYQDGLGKASSYGGIQKFPNAGRKEIKIQNYSKVGADVSTKSKCYFDIRPKTGQTMGGRLHQSMGNLNFDPIGLMNKGEESDALPGMASNSGSTSFDLASKQMKNSLLKRNNSTNARKPSGSDHESKSNAASISARKTSKDKQLLQNDNDQSGDKKSRGQSPPPPPTDNNKIGNFRALSPKSDIRKKGTGSLGKRSKVRQQYQAEMNDDLEVSYGQADWNMSLGNLQIAYGSTTNKNDKKIDTVPEDEAFELQFEPDDVGNNAGQDDETQNNESICNSEAIELGDKFKKQANAKFNKGDFIGSRDLYSEGLRVMSKIVPVTDEECELVATLYSNRAVTWFREKNFHNCILDCNKSLDYDIKYEKSYIRKWRALSALGQFDDAIKCLEEAKRQIPNSKKIMDELAKAEEEKEVLTVVTGLIDKGDAQKAKETMRPIVRASDNISLLLCAANADALLGSTDQAMEKVNKALKFNANNIEALELRGFILFISGEPEKGARLLQELYSRNRDNKKIASRMHVCSSTLSDIQKARTLANESTNVKRGYKNKHKESIEYYTKALEQNTKNLPSRSTLYSTLKMERAEQFLCNKQYSQAIEDCNDVLKEHMDDLQAWQLKTTVYVAMEAPKVILDELKKLKRKIISPDYQPSPNSSSSWTISAKQVDDLIRRAHFESKIVSVEDELIKMVKGIESGALSERQLVDGRITNKSSEYENRKMAAGQSSKKSISSAQSAPATPGSARSNKEGLRKHYERGHMSSTNFEYERRKPDRTKSFDESRQLQSKSRAARSRSRSADRISGSRSRSRSTRRAGKRPDRDGNSSTISDRRNESRRTTSKHQ